MQSPPYTQTRRNAGEGASVRRRNGINWILNQAGMLDNGPFEFRLRLTGQRGRRTREDWPIFTVGEAVRSTRARKDDDKEEDRQKVKW